MLAIRTRHDRAVARALGAEASSFHGSYLIPYPLLGNQSPLETRKVVERSSLPFDPKNFSTATGRRCAESSPIFRGYIRVYVLPTLTTALLIDSFLPHAVLPSLCGSKHPPSGSRSCAGRARPSTVVIDWLGGAGAQPANHAQSRPGRADQRVASAQPGIDSIPLQLAHWIMPMRLLGSAIRNAATCLRTLHLTR